MYWSVQNTSEATTELQNWLSFPPNIPQPLCLQLNSHRIMLSDAQAAESLVHAAV